jgi:hypothetical protein
VIPNNAKADAVDVKFTKDGMLTIKMPKGGEDHPSVKRLQIK